MKRLALVFLALVLPLVAWTGPQVRPQVKVIGPAAETPILELSGMSYWVARTETDSQNLTQLGSSGAGDAQFGSTSGADSNDPTSLPWYSTSDYDVTVDGVNYKIVGSNEISNGDFSAWTADNPDGWTVSTEDGTNFVTEHASGAEIQFDTGGKSIRQLSSTTSGTYYYYSFTINSVSGTKLTYFVGGVSVGDLDTATTYTGVIKATSTTGFEVRTWSGLANHVLSNVVVREVTASLGDHVYLPGTSGNYLSHPDSAALTTPNGFTLEVELSLPSPSTTQAIGGKYAGNKSFLMLNSGGTLLCYVSQDGSLAENKPLGNYPFAANEKGFLRYCYDGTSHTGTTFKSSDGSSWTQLGTNSTYTYTSIYDSSVALELGSWSGGTANPSNGNYYSAKLYDSDIGSGSGTPVMHWEASSMTQSGGADEESGGTWTINRSASGLKSTLVTRPVITANSAASTGLIVSNHADLRVGDSEDFTMWFYGRTHSTPTTSGRYMDQRSTEGLMILQNATNISGQLDYATAEADDIVNQSGPSLGTAELIAFGRRGTEGFIYTTTNGETTATVTADSLDGTNGDLTIFCASFGSNHIDAELFSFGQLVATGLTATQLASLKTELDTLLQGRSGDDALLLFLFILLPIFRKPKNNVVEFEPDEEWRDAA